MLVALSDGSCTGSAFKIGMQDKFRMHTADNCLINSLGHLTDIYQTGILLRKILMHNSNAVGSVDAVTQNYFGFRHTARDAPAGAADWRWSANCSLHDDESL